MCICVEVFVDVYVWSWWIVLCGMYLPGLHSTQIAHACPSVFMHTHTHTYTHTPLVTHTHPHMHTYAQTHTHKHTHTRILTHTLTHLTGNCLHPQDDRETFDCCKVGFVGVCLFVRVYVCVCVGVCGLVSKYACVPTHGRISIDSTHMHLYIHAHTHIHISGRTHRQTQMSRIHT